MPNAETLLNLPTIGMGEYTKNKNHSYFKYYKIQAHPVPALHIRVESTQF